MTHIVTRTFLTQLNYELMAQGIEVRDFNLVYSKDDHMIRQYNNHLFTEKLHIGASTIVKFEVKAFKQKSVSCDCKWKSAHSVFQFHYDLFETIKYGRYFLYLEAGVF